MLVACDQSSEVLKPGDRSFDAIPDSVSAQLAAVLPNWLRAVDAMRTDQVDALGCQAIAQRIAVGLFVEDQAMNTPPQESAFEQRFDQRDFVRAGTVNVGRQRNADAINQQHDLGAFATLGLAYASPPFFAEDNAPSAIAWSWSMCSRRSSIRNSMAQACAQMPAVDHSSKRRQQVVGEGKHLGKSFQRAPVRNTQTIPS